MSNTPESQPASTEPPSAEAQLRESLRRCSEPTIQAALAYRATKSPEHTLPIVTGIIERFLDPDKRPLLTQGGESLKLIDDLGLDSLTIMEIVMLVEEVMETTISNDELRTLTTIGEVQNFIDRKARGEPALVPASVPTEPSASASPPGA